MYSKHGGFSDDNIAVTTDTLANAFDTLDGEVAAGTIQQDHGIVTP